MMPLVKSDFLQFRYLAISFNRKCLFRICLSKSIITHLQPCLIAFLKPAVIPCGFKIPFLSAIILLTSNSGFERYFSIICGRILIIMSGKDLKSEAAALLLSSNSVLSAIFDMSSLSPNSLSFVKLALRHSINTPHASHTSLSTACASFIFPLAMSQSRQRCMV